MTEDAAGVPSGRDDTDMPDAAQRWSRALASELAGSLRHGLNQPLAAIAANANAGLRWLGRAEPDLREARHALERILADVERAAALVASTRQPGGSLLLHRQRRSIADLIEEAVSALSARLERMRVAAVLEFAPKLPALELDAVMMRQVMVTLVMHSSRAAADGDHRQVEVHARHDGDAITVELLDAGPGPGDDTERLFDPSQSNGGDAAELAASRRVVMAHGGTLTASARRRGGTRLRMRMPITPA